MTTKFCVVGSPISHSLSPVLHKAANSYLGNDFHYEAVQVESGGLAQFLNSTDYQGASVTMPLKPEAFELSSRASESVRLTKVANTLTKMTSGWSSANTDVYGISKALQAVPSPSQTLLIGSGATTFSALTALAELFPGTEVFVSARNDQAVNSAVDFGSSLGLITSSSQASASSLETTDLVMSLVPAGSYAGLWSELASHDKSPQGWLFDVSYNPWPSVPALAWGSERVISGLEMLIWQAIEQVQIFSRSVGYAREFDRDALYSVMMQAVSSK
jgi:shikimate dehydrogenase